MPVGVFCSSKPRQRSPYSTANWLDGPGFESGQGKDVFSFTKPPRPTLWPTQAPIPCVQGLFPDVKRSRREVDHLHLVPRLRVDGAIPPLPLYGFMAWRAETLPFFYRFIQNNFGTPGPGDLESWKQ